MCEERSTWAGLFAARGAPLRGSDRSGPCTVRAWTGKGVVGRLRKLSSGSLTATPTVALPGPFEELPAVAGEGSGPEGGSTGCAGATQRDAGGSEMGEGGWEEEGFPVVGHDDLEDRVLSGRGDVGRVVDDKGT